MPLRSSKCKRIGKRDIVVSKREIDFCTLGMFIIDEIHFLPPKSPVFDVVGGAGSYSALGARLFSAPPLSKSVGWIVDKGSDFPSSVEKQISSWSTSCRIRSDLTRLTTRGWNGYNSAEVRAFKYTTPKLRLDEKALTNSLLFSKSFHVICSPTRCISMVQSILSRRNAVDPKSEKPIFIWEPVPDLCTPFELVNLTNALRYVDICSPNHTELAGFMGDSDLGQDPVTGDIDVTAVENACEQLLSSMPGFKYALAIRCGVKGCYIAKNSGRYRQRSAAKPKRAARHVHGGLTQDMDMESLFADLLTEEVVDDIVYDDEVSRWLPAYFRVEDKERVVDPTGGGNAFLGGMGVALARGEDLSEAAAWGNIAASFAIEQVGMPSLRLDDEGEETWNGERVQARLKSYMARPELAKS